MKQAAITALIAKIAVTLALRRTTSRQHAGGLYANFLTGTKIYDSKHATYEIDVNWAGFKFTNPDIMIPSSADHEGEKKIISFGTIISKLEVTLEVAGGIISGSASMAAYKYTGSENNVVFPKESWIGPEHAANYKYKTVGDQQASDFEGNVLQNRTLTLPACYDSRQNWFGGIQQIVTPTIDGSISICIFGFCADLVSGFILPWNAK